MKTLLILNLMMYMNLNINLMLIIYYFYMNIFNSPLKQLIYLILYIIYMTFNTLILKQNFSMNLYILMIIFISGILIMFSYFISLINKMKKKNNTYKMLILNSFILLIMIFQIYQMKIILKYLNFNFYKNNKFKIIKNLYYKPNHLILLMIIIFLILMLFIMTKICYIKNKNLRTKKWKK
uniref:NADH dehydrogenase subunit 6 n=3 Tax=Bombus terrestris TaxID=30195 RepID=A0A0S2LST3_BOMTE|nr:NADH dehydrogenase subunit 6 [Bombus terrestris lusitanicus]YP_009709995.1 NADH dehydrogenase subunit 6 [Bombus terrestris terrestris]ALO64423.1 NADH dehydrogenase subunit 6 [Bombus terrestris]QFV14242.1 NADH dehydrogenase subunit 6 [Bombus terrestris lusitanicus]QFV14255.1 NADH dehydrogenase subunit 6 [Bombus terrestris terrestris]